MINWSVIGSLLLPNIGGWAGALTMAGQVKQPGGTAWYETIKRPSWNPPNWVFGPMWTVLYTSMGYASYVVYKDCGGFTEIALLPLGLYGAQLLINWTWSPVFFLFHNIGLALVHIILLDAAATACTISFAQVNSSTAYFMTPYLCWLALATFLNYTIWKLNKGEKKE